MTFDQHYPDDRPLPHTFPTPEGQIEMEWSLGSHSVALEVDLTARRGDWMSCGNESVPEDARTLDLNTDDDWSWLTGRIRQFAELAK